MSRNTYSIFLASVVCGIMALSACGDERPAGPTKAEIAAVAKGNNEFAFDLYRQLAKEAKPDENIFFSPYSIQAALAMTYAGARGETAEEMAKVLRFDRDQAKFHPAFAQLSKQIRNPGKDFKGEINVANAIWTSLDVRPEFKQVMDQHYDAGIRTIHFDDGARKIINVWVAEQTRQKINELLPKGSINNTTMMVLVNAIYMHAKWQTPFDKKDTKDEKFFRSPMDAVTVPMMHRKSMFRYAKVADAEIVELPYAGGQFSMVIVLPTDHDKLANVEKGLHQWEEWMVKLRRREVELIMPRIKLVQKYSLKKPLGAIGLSFATLNFSGIFLSGLPSNISVIHEATLDADEEGTTAAAATAIGFGDGAQKTAKVTLNRPFLLALRNTNEGALLFLGRVVLPATN